MRLRQCRCCDICPRARARAAERESLACAHVAPDAAAHENRCERRATDQMLGASDGVIRARENRSAEKNGAACKPDFNRSARVPRHAPPRTMARKDARMENDRSLHASHRLQRARSTPRCAPRKDRAAAICRASRCRAIRRRERCRVRQHASTVDLNHLTDARMAEARVWAPFFLFAHTAHRAMSFARQIWRRDAAQVRAAARLSAAADVCRATPASLRSPAAGAAVVPRGRLPSLFRRHVCPARLVWR